MGDHTAINEPPTVASGASYRSRRLRASSNRGRPGSSSRFKTALALLNAPDVALATAYFFFALQMSVGNATVPIYVLCLPLAFLVRLDLLISFPEIFGFNLALIAFATIIQVIASAGQTLSTRLLISAPAVACLAAAVTALARSSSKSSKSVDGLTLILRGFLFLNLAAQVGQLIGIFPYNARYENFLFAGFGALPRVSGFFVEPAQMAVAVGALAVTNVFIFPESRASFVTAATAVCSMILCPSFTATGVILLLGLTILLRIRYSRSRVFFLATAAFVGVALIHTLIGIPWIEDRANALTGLFHSGSLYFSSYDNLTVAVLVDGIVRAQRSIIEFPFGVGLNNFGIVGPSAQSAILPEWAHGLNLLDGSSLFAKIVAEFGFLSLPIYMGGALLFRKHWRAARTNKYSFLVVLGCFNFWLQHLRGGGYFDGGTLFFVAAFFAEFVRPRPLRMPRMASHPPNLIARKDSGKPATSDAFGTYTDPMNQCH